MPTPNRTSAATRFYRLAAQSSARILATSPAVQSLYLHRSVATGEVSFARSDIDLILIMTPEAAANGPALAALYRKLQLARLCNPALSHLELYDAASFASQSKLDTFWASLTLRSLRTLHGEPPPITPPKVCPAHALARFLLWAEYFFAISLQRHNARNIRKTALECWNAYAVAEGLLPEPLLLRAEMESHANFAGIDSLHHPAAAARFVFELAAKLHASRRPPLPPLAQTLIFQAPLPPLWATRQFVVLPNAASPLPPAVFEPGAFPATPQLLDLFLHYKNAFLQWILPPQLALPPPTPSELLRNCLYYAHPRFLYLPGFAGAPPPHGNSRLAALTHAADALEQNRFPAPPPELAAPPQPSVFRYYQNTFPTLHQQNQTLFRQLENIPAATRSQGAA